VTTKEREEHFRLALKSVRKQLGLQSRMETYYKRYRDYFLSIIPQLNGTNSAAFKTTIKPYVLDDILWTVFDMEDNKKEPMSLRSVGAYAIRPYVFRQTEIYYEDLTTLEENTKHALVDHVEVVETFIDQLESVEDYFEYTKEFPAGSYDSTLEELLWLVHKREFAEAKRRASEEITQGKKGYFLTFQGEREKSIYEYIEAYCEEEISQVTKEASFNPLKRLSGWLKGKK